MKDKFSATDRFNILKNQISLMAPLIRWLLIVGIIGGVLAIYLLFTYGGKLLPLNWDYTWLYIKSLVSFGDLDFNGKLLSKALVQEKLEQPFWQNFYYLAGAFTTGFIVFLFAGIKATVFFADKNAVNKLKDKHIRGTEIEKNIELLTKNADGHTITENGLKILREEETKHMLIVGGTGAGKTVLLKRLYVSQQQHIKNENAKWLIHDVKGDYIREFYDEERDFIFNFSDKRSIYFNIFDYIKSKNELESVVNTIIPRNPEEKDPIWTTSAQGILKGILIYCIKTDKKDLKTIKELLYLPAEKLKKKLASVSETEEAVAFLSGSETQTANYLSNMASRVQYFQNITDCMASKKSFDLAAWLKKEGQSTIFMLNNIKDLELNGTRIAVFLDTLIKIILDFEENKERRIYMILDELGAANKIPTLEKGIILGRSFGLSITVGIQEIAKLEKIYGQHDRKTILNNLSSKIILRISDSETAKILSETIGKKEISESDISNSVGLETNRDGVSFNKKNKESLAVLESEIMNLEDLNFYIKQPTLPWGITKTDYIKEVDKRETINKSFEPCEDNFLNIERARGEEEEREEKEEDISDFLEENDKNDK